MPWELWVKLLKTHNPHLNPADKEAIKQAGEKWGPMKPARNFSQYIQNLIIADLGLVSSPDTLREKTRQDILDTLKPVKSKKASHPPKL